MAADGERAQTEQEGGEEQHEDSGLSMVDVLEEERQREEDANAVLGGSDDRNCTYDMGYVGRQALYACETCSKEQPSGVCLACSLECHEGHHLYELYTKRHFRCDCGNSRMSGSGCKLRQNKQASNEENKYNQNFKGLYCTCNRPYPDPEDEVEDEMIQCIVCEDWYHGRHVGSVVPANDGFEEMICGTCMARLTFLSAYQVRGQVCKVKKEDTSAPQDVQVADGDCKSDVKEEVKKEDASSTQNVTAAVVDCKSDIKAEVKKEDAPSTQEVPALSSDCKSDKKDEPTPAVASSSQSSAAAADGGACLLDMLQQPDATPASGAAFWQEKWRSKLCICDKCKALYAEHNVSFLIDPEDTVHVYEEKGKTSGGSDYDRGMQALSSMDRVQQVEVIHGYNDMKSELKDFLQSFAENKKVVREEDITNFFEQMRARKRQKTGTGVQYFCK